MKVPFFRNYLWYREMKKVAIILLLGIYPVSITGIGIREFYCCGKLETTSIVFLQPLKEKNSNENVMSGCCKTTFKNVKVKDSHVAADVIIIAGKYFTNLHLYTDQLAIESLARIPFDVANATNPPPGHHGISIYILDCVYRI